MPLRTLSTALFLTLIVACGNQQAKNSTASTGNDNKDIKVETKLFTIESPSSGSQVSWGEEISIAYKATDSNVSVDSCNLSINGESIATIQEASYKWLVPQNTKVGNMPIVLTIWHDGGKTTKLNTTVKVHPPLPTFYDYEVVNTYPHDNKAFTQGLFYHNGLLYEGTGQNGKSTLRKVELKTGKVLQSVPLENQYFGEGIALLNDKIYQLTWDTRKGFIYNASSFDRIGEFDYPTEGWGLTTDGKYLIMSDGSSIIRFLDPNTFKEVRNIEVYTNKGAIVYLNELEYINGEIWANIFTQDSIIAIDPETGMVTKVVDMRNLLPTSLQIPNGENVLNGIAYDKSKRGNLYVTGKNWPKLYEVKLVKRQYDK